jgi:ribosomal protein S6--L-glutamate ligase
VTVGVARNPYSANVPDRLLMAARRLGIAARVIDMASLTTSIQPDGTASAADGQGVLEVDSVAPYLLFGYPAATHALRVLSWSARMQNPVEAVLLADDKAATAERLARAGVAQVATAICPFDLWQASVIADRVGYPVVVKRTHGAQGRWVRRAADRRSLEIALHELAAEGPGALIVQPEIAECEGRSVRAVMTGGRLLAATERTAGTGEWRSNIAGGAAQSPTELTGEERGLVESSARALGLRHAGVDILRTARGPRILEVNGCPDFTSMQPYSRRDLAEAVLLASA